MTSTTIKCFQCNRELGPGSIIPIDSCCQVTLRKLQDQPGRKFDSGKIRWHLLFYMTRALIEVVKVLMFGEDKYGTYNWAKGINYSRCYDASQRHGNSWWVREDLDPETKLSHLAHKCCNDLFLLYFALHPEKYKQFDDRPEEKS